MCCDSREAASFSRSPYHDKHHVKHYLSVLLCLLALAAQPAASTVHMWEINAQQGAVPTRVAPWPCALAGSNRVAVALTARPVPRKAAHDSTLCPVCKALAQLQRWAVTADSTIATPTVHSWLSHCRVSPSRNSYASVTRPRAPPLPS